jgi:hypothetical protein
MHNEKSRIFRMQYFNLYPLVALLAGLFISAIAFPASNAATVIPASAALNHVSLENAGFRIRVVQADSPTPLTNTIERAEQQLAGTLIDPSTGNPFVNVADVSGANTAGYFIVPGIINYSTSRGGFAGNFIPDDQMPGLPGATSDPNESVANVAMEISAYLALKPGNYHFGVNATDGFSASVQDISGAPITLGESEASGETAFDFSVSKEGFYPFRFVYVHGGGEGSIELFSIEPESEDKILLNDPTDDRSVKAYYQEATASVVSLQPDANSEAVAANTSVSAIVFHTPDGLDTNTIRLTLDSAIVTPTINSETDTNYLKIAYQPPAALTDGTHVASLVFGANNSELMTNQWTFKVGLPAEIRLAIARNGSQLTITWSGGGVLQQSASVAGPWSDITSAAGTVTITPQTPTAFYRVHRP